MMEEIWKDIGGYEGCYQVSNIGNIKSLERQVASKANSKRLIEGRILKIPFINFLKSEGIKNKYAL